jgi:hypothetical protein
VVKSSSGDGACFWCVYELCVFGQGHRVCIYCCVHGGVELHVGMCCKQRTVLHGHSGCVSCSVVCKDCVVRSAVCMCLRQEQRIKLVHYAQTVTVPTFCFGGCVMPCWAGSGVLPVRKQASTLQGAGVCSSVSSLVSPRRSSNAAEPGSKTQQGLSKPCCGIYAWLSFAQAAVAAVTAAAAVLHQLLELPVQPRS